MEQVQYSRFRGFEHVYLEDSFVLDIQTAPSSAEIALEIVLTENHPLYKTPPLDEQYCYRKARIYFPDAERVEWIEKSMIPSTDATGNVDYGNIDEFFLANEHYHVRGDWGELDIVSSPPLLEVQDFPSYGALPHIGKTSASQQR